MAEEIKKTEDQGVDTGLTDRISTLPDHILSVILSHLSVEESARTSVLSARWRSQWLLSPINIWTYGKDSNWCDQTLPQILNLNPGPIRSFNYDGITWQGRPTFTPLVKTLTQKGIQRLVLWQNFAFTLPLFLLECESLLDLQLVHVTFPHLLPERIFPNLRRLCLSISHVRHHTLSDLLSRSSITDLEIPFGYGKAPVIVVESNSLKRLAVSNYGGFRKLVIKDTPNLECLNFESLLTRHRDVEIRNAPKLKVLDCIDMAFNSLQLGESLIDRTNNLIKLSGGSSSQIHSLTTLAIQVEYSFVDHGKYIPYLLRCFPCLETLDVLMRRIRSGDVGDHVEQHFDIDCLNHHLKYVQLEGYSGEQSQVDFANFIISRARVLKTMIIICGSKWEEQWVETQKQLLLLGNRASKAAQVILCETRKLRNFRDKFPLGPHPVEGHGYM